MSARRGANHGRTVLEYVRWVMVRKRDAAAAGARGACARPARGRRTGRSRRRLPAIDPAAYDLALAGSPYRWGDYAKGERIDHIDGVTVEEAEHMIATRLYQNTARCISTSSARARAGSGGG